MAINGTQEGVSLSQAEQHQEALDLVFDLWFEKGRAYDTLKQWYEVLAAYGHPRWPIPEPPKADFAFWKQTKKVLAAFDRALRLEPHNGTLWFCKGWAHESVAQGQEARAAYSKAVAAFDRALRLEPHNGTVWFRKGEAHRRLQQEQAALTAFDRALELGLNHAMVWYGKGRAHNTLAQEQAALTAFDRYLALAPDDADIWERKGLLHMCRGFDENGTARLDERSREQWQAALAAFDRALELNPNMPPGMLWGNTYLAHLVLGHLEQMLALFSKSSWAYFSSDARFLRDHLEGVRLLQARRYQEALDCFDRVFAAAGPWWRTSARCWSDRGLALHQLSRHSEAIYCFDQALAHDPHYEAALVNKADALGMLERYEEAIACCDRAIGLNPRNVAAFGTLAALMLKVGRPEAALVCLAGTGLP